MADKDVELSEVGRRSSLTFALEESEQQSEAKFHTPSPPRDVPPPPPTEATDGGSSSSRKRDLVARVMVDKDAVGAFCGNPIVWIVGLVVAGVAGLLIVILVPLHFADLDYWQVRVLAGHPASASLLWPARCTHVCRACCERVHCLHRPVGTRVCNSL